MRIIYTNIHLHKNWIVLKGLKEKEKVRSGKREMWAERLKH